jgi:hypothetical protein
MEKTVKYPSFFIEALVYFVAAAGPLACISLDAV